MRPLIILQHGDDDPPDTVGRFLDAGHYDWRLRRLNAGEELPARVEDVSGLIVLGGEMHAHQVEENPFLVPEKALLRAALAAGVPLLGICLGSQLLAEAAGGTVYRRDEDEVGWVSVDIVDDDELFTGVSSPFMALEWHTYSFTLPPGAKLLARRPDGVQAFRVGDAWGLQFHPEVSSTTVTHWVAEDQAELERRRPGLAARILAETASLADDYRALCERLVGNWLRAVGIAPLS